MIPIHHPLGILGRFILINVVPFFLVFHLVMKRRRQLAGENFSELRLVAGEVQIVGLLGYYVILSIFFFSIPVLRYDEARSHEVLLVEPDGFTVFLIGAISYALVVGSIYLKLKRRWAYRMLVFLMGALLLYSFFSVLEFGLFSIVPVAVFAYFFFKLREKALVEELKNLSL